ncbi:MAG: GNAT family N-acetyltransferase [Granulosicoccaceae bacterium]
MKHAGENSFSFGQWAKDNGAARLDLLTEKTNYKAHHLYEKLGYAKEFEDYHAYSLNLPK